MDKMDNLERMKAGLIYDCDDPKILGPQTECLKYLAEFNSLQLGDEKRMTELLELMLAQVGENCYIQPPFNANWGGKHLHLGSGVYANFNLTLVDDGDIYVGDNVKFGPNVTVISGSHPINIELREKLLQFTAPVHISKNVWVGAGSIILPGVTIGENSVIGAGSVVTKDIPANVVAYGNPCRVARKIGERDDLYYFKDRKIDIPLKNKSK